MFKTLSHNNEYASHISIKTSKVVFFHLAHISNSQGFLFLAY